MKETSQSNSEIRHWYKTELAKIPGLNKKWIEDKIPIEERAELAWKFRREKRLEARDKMSDKQEVEQLRERDRKVYGNPDGPNFEFLVNRAKSKGLKGNEIYEAIIKGSYRTDAGIDEKLL